jgi:dienelactone hydrolase
MPAGGKNLPTIILVHEIWSVHEYFRDLCRRLALRGYLAIAPDFFARQGDVSKAELDDIRKIVATVPDAQVMSDLDATRRGRRRTAAIRARWASPASAGAGASPGSTPRTTRR